MKKRLFIFLICFASIYFLNGCISVSRSPSPRFYRLSSMSDSLIEQKLNIASDEIIGVGPVKIPEYLNRPQIVTINDNQMVNFAQFDRWGESLDLAIARVLNENLTATLESRDIELYPWNILIPVKFQVVVDVIELEANLKKDIVFVAQWSIVDLKNKNLVFSKRSALKEAINPHNYSGSVAALNKVLSKLSVEIAQELSQLSSQSKS